MSTPKSPGDHGAGAGLNLSSPKSRPDEVAVQKSQQSIASRAVALSSYFLSGALCINLSQFLGTPLYLINQDWYNAWIAFTKQSFGLLTMTLTQAFSPTKVIVSGDESVRGQILRKTDGTLLLDFPERLVLIANHQIYTDWLYLWWTAYCSGMHGRLYIILKESLKRIPILGWGMQMNQFIFLKRNWEQDRGHMAQALSRLNKLADPMWLLIFPEGTNLAPSTRQKSAIWASKNKMKDMRHCLLPRSTGLRFCLQELKDTVDYVYDCTIAYEGVPRGAFAQDIFTLKAGYIEGRPPKSVSMYWRRFAVKDIPLHNEKAFELWLIARWREKDLLIENYLIHGHFPADKGITRTAKGELKRGAGHLDVEIKSSHWYEFLQIFAPMGILAMVLYIFYGALPNRFFKSESGKAVKESADDLKTLSTSVTPPSMPDSFSLDMIFDKEKQSKTFGNAGMALAQWVQSPEAKRMMSRADLVQRWLEDPQKLIVESLTGNADKQNFLKSLKEEENRRRKRTNKHQGSFWDDLEQAESRAGSVKGISSGGKHSGSFYQDLARAQARSGKPSGTFYQDLARAQAARSIESKPRTAAAKKARFWDDLGTEENRRMGSVMTLPSISSSSSRTAINSLDSSSTAVGGTTAASKPQKLVKQAPKKVPVNGTASKGAAASATRPPKLPQALATKSPVKKAAATNATPPKKPTIVANKAVSKPQPIKKTQPSKLKAAGSSTAAPKQPVKKQPPKLATS